MYARQIEATAEAIAEVGQEYHDSHPLGRHVRHDPRSIAYAYAPRSSRDIVSIEHARHIPWLDQGSTGACTGNACDGALGTTPLYEALPTPRPPLDEAYARDVLYHLATTLDGYDGTYPPTDTGSDGLAVAKGAQSLGLIAGYQHALNVTAALDALLDGPVITGVTWHTGCDNPDADGIVTITGAVRGGHEIVARQIVLAGDKLPSGKIADTVYVIFDNSWGPDWGYQGRFCMTLLDWTALLKDDGDVTILTAATSPPPVPQPDASFQLSPAVAAVIAKRAARLGETSDAWLQHHLNVELGLTS